MSRPDSSATANVGTWLEARAELHPDRAALVVDSTGETLSYAALAELSYGVAHALLDRGVQPGDRVALALGSEPLYLAIYFAVARIGAVLVPLNTRLTLSELEWQLAHCEPVVAICGDPQDLPRMEAVAVERASHFGESARSAPPVLEGGEAPHVLLYTSGTTGSPKAAMLPHRKTVFNTLNAVRFLGLEERDVVVVPIPLFHSYGLKILSVPALFAGATVVLVDKFDPASLQETVGRHGATLLGAVPVMYQRMFRAGLRTELLSSLRFGFSAGAAIDADLIRAYAEAGLPIVQGYGQTETSILCALDAEHALSKAGSVGRPVHHGELRIADETGATVPAGVSGEIVVRGPTCMLGYFRDPEATATSRHGDWHRTGDLGVADADGFITLVGRLKEMYISGGENVYPAEVERVLEQHPDVEEAAVVGVADPEWGEVGHAYVVRSRPIETQALLDWTRERLAGYKRPRRIEFVAELPRTAAGKIQKHLLGSDGKIGDGVGRDADARV